MPYIHDVKVISLSAGDMANHIACRHLTCPVLLNVLEKFTSRYINLTPFEKNDPEGRKLPPLKLSNFFLHLVRIKSSFHIHQLQFYSGIPVHLFERSPTDKGRNFFHDKVDDLFSF